jgi:hypothetical protein
MRRVSQLDGRSALVQTPEILPDFAALAELLGGAASINSTCRSALLQMGTTTQPTRKPFRISQQTSSNTAQQTSDTG